MVDRFIRVPSDREDVNDLQARLERILRALADSPLASARQISSEVFLAAGTPTAINHGLGRKPAGWFLTDVKAAATVHRTAWDELTISLQASADCVVYLVVF